MSLPALFLSSAAVILALMSLLWLLSLTLKNASIVDIFWGSGFVIIAWLVLFQLRETFLSTSAPFPICWIFWAFWSGWSVLLLKPWVTGSSRNSKRPIQ